MKQDHNSVEQFKLERLRAEIKIGIDQIKNGEAVDGEQFFNELLNDTNPDLHLKEL